MTRYCKLLYGMVNAYARGAVEVLYADAVEVQLVVPSRHARGAVEVRPWYGRGMLVVRSRYARGTVLVRSRYITLVVRSRCTLMVRSSYARGAVEVRSWYGLGAVEVRSWCTSSSLLVQCGSLTFQRAILYITTVMCQASSKLCTAT